MRCEDFPCCGHENGCCPDYDDNGNQTNMVCTCGAKLPITSRYSICDSCLRSDDEDGGSWNDSWTNYGWAGDGSGEDDLADYNQNEADDYRDEGYEDSWLDGSYEE